VLEERPEGGAARLDLRARTCAGSIAKLSLLREYSPFLGATGCAKLPVFRRVSGIPKSPHRE
jgi:hypothetical protein